MRLEQILPLLLVIQMKQECEEAVRVFEMGIVGKASQLSEVKLQHDLPQLTMMVGHVRMVEQEFKLKHLLSVVQMQELRQQQ